MTFQDIENEEDQILHNRFTAYLLVAVKRKRSEYRAKQTKKAMHERAVEVGEMPVLNELCADDTLEEWLEIRIKWERLMGILYKMQQRERNIVLEHLLYEQTFSEIANRHGMMYKTVAAVYYRAIQKIRKEWGETNELL